ncbi:MAG TPA: hypothetical protein ENJ56_09070 [Anaerolineae bacterium]|nr:hypothetical protein [Anaerolineae bacterium]
MTMVTLLATISTIIAFTQKRWLATMRQSTRPIKRWAGAILALVGVWLLLSAWHPEWFVGLFPSP